MVEKKGKLKSWFSECLKSEGKGVGGRLTPEARMPIFSKFAGPEKGLGKN